ncbi:MAG: PP2C family protein-serine/threonine phosphatase [Leptospiraceae bacterium]|nr:PP2C family protein-serine/threonine phosphatase [Leptospiraceae bacterium]
MIIIFFIKNLIENDKNPDYINFRERYTYYLFIITHILGIGLVMGFSYLDILLELKNFNALLLSRIICTIMYLSNIILLFVLSKSRKAIKFFIFLGFLYAAILTSVVSHLAGYTEISYWPGFMYTLTIWFAFIPFSILEMISLGFFYTLVFNSIIIFFNFSNLNVVKIIEYNIFLVSMFTTGATLTVTLNHYQYNIFKNQLDLKTEKNKLQQQNIIMQSDINLARKIQTQLIPKLSSNKNISTIYKPMIEVGGDLFDVIEFNDSKKIGIFISDVSGHGVAAAFITSMIKTIILQAKEKLSNPANLLFYMNEILQSQIAGNFVTVFYGIYNPDDRSILYSSAGHNQPYIITPNKVTQLQKGQNTALAMFPNKMLELSNKKFTNFTDILEPDSKLLLYTDGLVEARPIDSNIFFEYANMEQIFIENHKYPCDVFLDNVMKELSAFRKSDQFDDDICLICLDV